MEKYALVLILLVVSGVAVTGMLTDSVTGDVSFRKMFGRKHRSNVQQMAEQARQAQERARLAQAEQERLAQDANLARIAQLTGQSPPGILVQQEQLARMQEEQRQMVI